MGIDVSRQFHKTLKAKKAYVYNRRSLFFFSLPGFVHRAGWNRETGIWRLAAWYCECVYATLYVPYCPMSECDLKNRIVMTESDGSDRSGRYIFKNAQ